MKREQKRTLHALQPGDSSTPEIRGLQPCLSGEPKTGGQKCDIKLSELGIKRDTVEKPLRKKPSSFTFLGKAAHAFQAFLDSITLSVCSYGP